MYVRMTIARNGKQVFEFEFPVDERGELQELARVGFAQYRRQFPSQPLIDHRTTLKFETA